MNSGQMKPAYLESTTFIDWKTPEVFAKAKALRGSDNDDGKIAERCFLWVRDEIKHSHDFAQNPVTIKSSEVLLYGTGYCYAKSHLLAALLRANGIPAALCYQRLRIDIEHAAFCIHGLNAVYLKPYGWYRIDARGNKPGVSAQFCPPTERLAFSHTRQGEYLLETRFSEPLPEVIRVLENYQTESEVFENLPDFEEIHKNYSV